jgi:hypothetical protein
MMELTDTQKDAVRRWAAEGCSLAEIQKRLGSEFGVSMTYLDVRFLAIDMGLDLADKQRPSEPSVDIGAENRTAPGLSADGAAPASSSGEAGVPPVTVEVDRVTKPGCVVSGSVTFSDGVTSGWGLDQFGRLVLDKSDDGYRPDPDDLVAFQQELRDALARRGF